MRHLLFLFALASAAAQAQTPTLELDLGSGVSMDMILVQPGSFMQGSPAGEAGREADEGPQRRVTISLAYYMAKFPVTYSQFERFAEVMRYRTEAEKGESGGFGVVNGKVVQQKQFNWRNPGFGQSEGDPVCLVSAPDAAAFCQWLTTKSGRLCELPTEAQWEHACRAGSQGARYAEPVDAVAWHRGNSGDATNEVGRKEANAWGFHDFYGPVWQWCRDWYAPYTPGSATDPLQTNPNLSDKPRQVLRGGSFLSDAAHSRSAERYRNDARSRNADNGFRIVCSITQRAAPAEATPTTKGFLIEPPSSNTSKSSSGDAPSIIGWAAFLFAIITPVLVGFFVLRAVFRQIRDWMTPGATAAASNMTGPEAAAMFSARPSPLGHRFAFNLTDDGFFITAPEAAAGTHLKYECVVGGRMIADDIVFTPGPEGHFIFTGKKPSSVRVQTTGGAAGTESSHSSSYSDDDDYHRRNMSSSSSSRYPSAYWSMEAPVWIIADDTQPAWMLERTRRSFSQACVRPLGALHAGCWAEAGAWKSRKAAFLPEVEGPMVLVGATLEGHSPTQDWREALQGNGGVFRAGDRLPRLRMLWLNEAAAKELEGATLNEIAEAALRRGWRVIRHSTLDVGFDPRPRLLQVITSLQRGGAERLVLDLHEELPRNRVGACLMTLGSPTRAPFPAPADVIRRRLPPDAALRAGEIMRVAKRLGVDAVHAHLVDGETLAALDPELPLMVTLHNQRQSWPEGIERLAGRTDALLIGCSQVVTREIEQSFPQHMARTIWNGIREMVSPRPALKSSGSLVIVAIANPRPQKRLPLLIDVLAEVPGAVLKIAGEASSVHPEAQEEVRRCREKISAHGLADRVKWLGAVEDVPALLVDADVFVSTSSHEGLSLAQLEALAAGVPVVATDVGGAAEVAARHPGRMILLPVDAKPAEFAAAIRELAGKRGDGVLTADFTTRVMAERHTWLLRALISRSKRQPRGLLLVTNNFSTGGAQSSARRLLLKLRDMSEKVRAVVLQENPLDPTPGRAALVEAGVQVMALTPEGAMRALMPLLEEIADDPPEAVAFWNVIPEHKVLLADALHDTRVFDVSPGEMLFESLERYFSKPRHGLPYADAKAYGRRLMGVIVKHESEVALAREMFQRPVSLISNGVNVREAAQEPESARWMIGTAARIHPHKRLEDLIDAFRIVHMRMPQARLRIAGGPDAGQEAYAETLKQSTTGLPIEWRGDVTDVAVFHDTLCVFAMISEPSGCPNASLEAMASALPVVATAVGGAVQQVEDGVTGFLTPRRDVEAMAAALLRVLEDDELRAQMRVAAQERVRRLFSLSLMAERYRSVCLGR